MKIQLKTGETREVKCIKYLNTKGHRWAIHKGFRDSDPDQMSDYFTVSHYKTGTNACPYQKLSMKEMEAVFTEYINNISDENITKALNGVKEIN